MATRLYLVRHGETHWNAIKKFQGHSDIPLSPKGRQQAITLAKYMQQRGIAIDAAYSSDLCRTVETAEILMQHSNIPITTIRQLREINFGEWEGYTLEELHGNYPEQLGKWWQDPLTTRISGGESLADVVERVIPEVKNMIKNHPEQNVLLASHGGVIRVIISYVLGINMNQYWRLHLDNCSLNVLHFPSGTIEQGVLELYNQTAI